MIGGMIFAARIGTAFTVEIGSMQMSGQLDALDSWRWSRRNSS